MLPKHVSDSKEYQSLYKQTKSRTTIWSTV